ncbi:TonB-dependent receptor plug domain-containing protein [Sandarakinorhabdus rubra]|uniref:TonB-dependent receptor plug domain-containing protein n=1 Tax=Sandarakinorhabdus rubra TaxID=2672568 RepID=UPI0013D9787C|nr:TonB-dependent receptor plug domain-containing protein [Sandarakinorhabdus rubra]
MQQNVLVRGLGFTSLAALVAALTATTATAQTATAVAAADTEEAAPEEMVVTGSRIVRDGSSAPVPTTVVTADDIVQRNPINIADYVNQLPAIGQGQSPRATTQFVNTNGGANQINARGLGINRTLVLLDGRRVVGSGLLPAVDVNLLPQNLVKRVDVVTGGASAAYGSDAVAGVVNFILDTDYEGIKGQINYGQTDKNDGRVISGDLAFGTKFAGGRGRLLLSGNYAKSDSIRMSEGLRDWFQPGLRTLNNPNWTATNGQTGQIVRTDVGLISTPGGVIAGGPLAGINFLPGGAVGQFQFGNIIQGSFQSGGSVEPASIRAALLPTLEYYSVYGRLSYDVTDNVTAIFEATYAGNSTNNWSAYYNRNGTGTNGALLIQRDNPFIPVTVQQAMDQAGVTSFRMNRIFYDMINGPGQNPGDAGYNRRQSRLLFALEGSFADSGKWRAYYQRGRSQVWYTRDNNIVVSRFNQAVDVTANPATGGIAGVAVGAPVCRSTLTNPTNGCIPMNLFGEGSLGASSVAWVTGAADGFRTRQDLDIALDVYSIDAQYSPFSTWAGPVSIAAGFEYREESFVATSDAQSQSRVWFVGNFQPGGAGYNVKEFFAEALVPLLKDDTYGNLELNGAVRRTDYSTSGEVTTWKVGATYGIGDFRVRATRSRDIRAPNLNDLFAPQSTFVNQFQDRSLPDSPTVPFVTLNGGNPLLTPEIADTWTVGGAYQPSWAPGLTATVDWYNIKIKDAIFGVGGQLLLDLCYGFNRPASPSACQSIVPVAGSTGLAGATLLTGGINAQNVEVEGIDYEISYRTNLSNISAKLPGSLSLRVLASQRITDQTNLPGDTTPPDLGTPTSLKWRGFGSATYAVGPSRTTVTARYLGPGVVNNLRPTERNGLPAEWNRLPAVWYWELSQNFDIKVGNSTVTVFGVVENLFDQDPPPTPNSGTSFGTSAVYDLLGRSYRLGVRFKM